MSTSESLSAKQLESIPINEVEFWLFKLKINGDLIWGPKNETKFETTSNFNGCQSKKIQKNRQFALVPYGDRSGCFTNRDDV